MITSSINTSAKQVFKPNIVAGTLARIGGFIPDKVHDYCDLTKTGSMKRAPLYIMLMTIVVGSRYLSARGKDEKREILTRDPLTITSLIFTVPVLKKFTGMFLNKKTGIPISKAEDYDQLTKWFSVENAESFNGIRNGLAGFCRNIKKLGGDVIKDFSILDKNSKNIINDIAKSLGYTKKITNKNIAGLIKKAEKSTIEAVQGNLKKLKEMFIQNEKGMNPLLQKASHLKSITDFGCIAAAILFLGGLLPWFNIQHTKKLYEKKKAENKNLNNDQPKTLPVNNSNMMNKFEKFQKTGQLV